MSVIFGAYHRMAKKKEIENKLKRKAQQQREKRQKAMDAVHEQIGPLPTESPATRIWTFLLDGNPYSIVFYKDTLDVYCNGNEVESRIDFEDDGEGNRIDFEVGPHKARITSAVNQCSKEGIVHSLTIDGSAVPE